MYNVWGIRGFERRYDYMNVASWRWSVEVRLVFGKWFAAALFTIRVERISMYEYTWYANVYMCVCARVLVFVWTSDENGKSRVNDQKSTLHTLTHS